MRKNVLLAAMGCAFALQTACTAPQYVAEPTATPYGIGIGAFAAESVASDAAQSAFDDDPVAATGFHANDAMLKVRTAYPTRSAPAGAPAPLPTSSAPAPTPAPASTPALAKEASSDASSLQANRGPMLVYTARLSLATFEAEAALTSVEKLAQENGGFLSRRERLSITIRVPAERFAETLRAIEKLGDVIDRNVQARDVTDEFFDLEARLRSARAVHARLLELLQKADAVEESIAIEKELGRVLQEIERLEGRLKLLRDQLAYSTITASFRPKATEVVGKKTPFRLPGEWLDQLGLGRLMKL